MSHLALLLLKWTATTAFSVGAVGAVAAGDLPTRRLAAYRLAAPGYVWIWVAGFALARSTGTSLGSGWITGGMLLSTLALAAAIWVVEREDRPRAVVAVVLVASVLAAAGLMTFKPGHRAKSAHAEVAE